MSKSNKDAVNTKTEIISGKRVLIASAQDVKASSSKIQGQYAQALENLKNR